MTITREFADEFAREWISAWNSHDLDRILTHYADDFEMSSPYIAQIAGEPSGTLQGKAAVGAYWKLALTRMPDLHFQLVGCLVGARSITLYYRGARGMAAEVLFFAADGHKIEKAAAHYA